MTELQQTLTESLPEVELRLNEPFCRHTSFRIGGPAEVMAFPKSCRELQELLHVSHLLGLKPAILGAGTNVLAPDEGKPGLVICMKDALTGMERTGNRIRVMAGVSLARAAVFAAEQGLSGLEFAHGIPGSLGGGVYMNAGAYGGEISQVLCSAEVMDLAGNLASYTGEEMEFSYRHSRLENHPGIVISAWFSLTPKPSQEIRQTMRELMERRKASQPLDLPSAGSAFKRPAGGYAATLIQQAGLKGFRIGGAAVSEKHAGFVVNLGGATARDVKTLLETVSQRVWEASGIRLEPEIRIW